jgi:hypothetical protein
MAASTAHDHPPHATFPWRRRVQIADAHSPFSKETATNPPTLRRLIAALLSASVVPLPFVASAFAAPSDADVAARIDAYAATPSP